MAVKSRAEERVKILLDQLDINYRREFYFDDLRGKYGDHLRFDFAIYDDEDNLHCLLELQGEQHFKAIKHFGGYKGYEKQRYYDGLKEKYCSQHGYKLIKIPYYNFDYINDESLLQAINL